MENRSLYTLPIATAHMSGHIFSDTRLLATSTLYSDHDVDLLENYSVLFPISFLGTSETVSFWINQLATYISSGNRGPPDPANLETTLLILLMLESGGTTSGTSCQDSKLLH
eukprot:7613581-Ditylum_brightwellii.AAC.1